MEWQGQQPYPHAEVYVGLRNQIFALKPGRHGLTPELAPSGVWGVVADLGFESGIATLVALADGTTSMYLSGGGAGVGYGALESPRRAAAALLRAAPLYLRAFQATDTHALPAPEQARFYLLTFSGVLGAEGSAEEMSDEEHPLAILFVLAQNLLTEMLALSEELSAQEPETLQS